MTHVSLFLEVVIRIWTEFTLDSVLPDHPQNLFQPLKNCGCPNYYSRCGVMTILKSQCKMWDMFWVVNWLCNSSLRNDYTHCDSKPQILLYFNIRSPFVFISRLCYNLHYMTETRFSLRETLRYAWRVQWRDVGSMSQTLQCENSPTFKLVVRAYNNISNHYNRFACIMRKCNGCVLTSANENQLSWCGPPIVTWSTNVREIIWECVRCNLRQ